MTLTEAGRRMLGDARAMLAFAEDAEQRVRNNQMELRGHLRLFATVHFGQFLFTRLIASFMQRHPSITVELIYSNRPVRMIEEGCDAGLIVGDLTDDAVVARPAGQVARCLAAAPPLLKSRPAVEKPADLKAWPWLALSSEQFGGARTFRLSSPKRASQTLNVSPILLTVGASSLRTAAQAGLGVAELPLWLIKEDLTSGPGARPARLEPGAGAGPRHLFSAMHAAGTSTRVCRFCHRIRQNRTGSRFALKSSRLAIPRCLHVSRRWRIAKRWCVKAIFNGVVLLRSRIEKDLPCLRPWS
jgi:DNA-binding transcriptional LysR family regulator